MLTLAFIVEEPVVPGPGGFYLPQNEANIWPMESNIGVIWTTKSDFLQKSGVPFTVSDDILLCLT